MDIQRLRNLTTGRLHTEMEHIYKDLESVLGRPGLMTHVLPNALRAVEPWLREHVKDERFWDDKFDLSHTGDFDLPVPTNAERKEMLKRYSRLANPLSKKEVVVVLKP